MTDAHGQDPGDALALRLGAFAEAATAVLDSPSRCGQALFDALHEFWQALQNVPGHLPPYRDDRREVVERFVEARTQLGWALSEASALAAAPHGRRPPEDGTPARNGPGGGADPEDVRGGGPGAGNEGRHPARDEGDGEADGEGEDWAEAYGQGTGTGGGSGSGGQVGGTGEDLSAEENGTEAGPEPPGRDQAVDFLSPAADGVGSPGPSKVSATPVASVTPAASEVAEPSRTPGPADEVDQEDPGAPTGDRVPEAPETPGARGIPEVPGAREVPGVPEVPGIPGAPVIPPKPSVPTRRPGSPQAGLGAAESGGRRSAPGTSPGSPSGSGAAPVEPLADFAAVLERLESELRSEQIRYLPPPAPPRRDDRDADAAELVARIWRRVHMALLRLPHDVAAEWRTTTAARASLAGLAAPDEEVGDPDVIVPGLPDGLHGAERLPLDLADLPAAAAVVDPKFHRYLGLGAAEIGTLPPGDPRPAWAVRAAQAERLAALDPELHVALLHDHQPGSLAEREHRDKYERRLASLLRTAGQGLDAKMAWTRENRLGAAHNLDMVLGGLVHRRPAAPDSWWYQWRTRVSRILIPLAEDANYEVIFRPLEDLRRDFATEYTIAETVKGVAGAGEPEVQWVVWTALRRKKNAAYGPNRHKGRVVVRPAEPTRR
ncbi:hypothetical protein [Streptomyces sp. NPDC096934]|uniref:hypothetical protein n=1 Tax=Streptomyces sp. NPDC096934 TaxID=3155551 RepID=UPI00332A1140